jgi:microcin C transport system substrate-binding protein
MWVLPKHYWETRDFGSTTLDIPLGSGAYRITEVDPGRKIVYERVDDYWGKDIAVMKGRFNFDRVVYDYFSDENVIHEAHKAGVVDARLEGVAKRWATEYDFPGYRDGYFIKDLIVTERPFGMAFGLLFNLRMEKFRDVRVREAIALAYDFEWNNRVLNHSFYERVDSFFENSDLAQTGLPSEAELALLEPFRGQIPERVFTEPYVPTRTSGRGYARANLLEAARLLKEAGYDVVDGVLVDHATGRPFTIEFLTVSVYLERFLMPLVASLERLGIFSTVRTVEVSQYINRVGKFDFEGSLRTYSQTLVPGTELRNYWGSDAAERIYSRNTPGIKDPVVDALIETIIGSRSREELIAACRALDRVMLWNFYAIPGFFPPGYRYGYWDKFEKPEIQARYRSGFFDTWWYSEEKARQVAIGMQRMQKGEY